LKWALRLLGLALTIGPILIALGAHDWDVKKAVLPSDEEIRQISDQVTGIFGGGFSQETLTFGEPILSGNIIRLPVTFRSPLKVPIKITDFSVMVTDQGAQAIELQMEETGLDIPANGTAALTLVGSISGALPSNPKLAAISASLEVYGVTIQLHPSIQGG